MKIEGKIKNIIIKTPDGKIRKDLISKDFS